MDIYSQYVKAYILFAQDNSLPNLNKRLMAVYKKDTNRLDVLQSGGYRCVHRSMSNQTS